jgi:predicted alpha/beta-fold hydrolase
MTKELSNNSFKPAWWLPGGHSQTLWRKLSPPVSIGQKRERVELGDGDFIDLDWADPVSPADSRDGLIVVILHGLCGCSASPYVIALQTLLSSQRIASVALNFRSCSGEINRLARAYHSGISEDANEVFTQLFAAHPRHRFAFVGYSLGANVLLKWLGEIATHPQVYKAVAVSTPFALSLCSKAMLTGVSRHYGSYFVRRLLRDVAAKQRHFAATGNSEQLAQLHALGDLRGIATIWEFDDRVTAPLHGYRDAEDYYTRCSSLRFLDAIGTDTLLIQSRNDPLIPANALPDPGRLPANVRLELQGHGGHVGFISGQRENWLEQRIVQFVMGASVDL